MLYMCTTFFSFSLGLVPWPGAVCLLSQGPEALRTELQWGSVCAENQQLEVTGAKQEEPQNQGVKVLAPEAVTASAPGSSQHQYSKYRIPAWFCAAAEVGTNR